jgi:hypothetical protein
MMMQKCVFQVVKALQASVFEFDEGMRKKENERSMENARGSGSEFSRTSRNSYYVPYDIIQLVRNEEKREY